MRRRSVLATLAAGLAGLGGCFGGSGDPDGNGDATPARTVEVSVEGFAVVPEIVGLATPDSITTFGTRDDQYLLAEISTGEALTTGELELVAGEESYTPMETIGEGSRIWNYGESYFAGEDQSGWLVFEVPKPLSIEEATLTWPGGERSLSPGTLDRLARPPTTFGVSVDVTEHIEPGSPANVAVAVENTGDAPGIFVGALNRYGPSSASVPEAAAEVVLAAGDGDTWTYSYETDDEEGTFEFEFVWRDGSVRREVEMSYGSA